MRLTFAELSMMMGGMTPFHLIMQEHVEEVIKQSMGLPANTPVSKPKNLTLDGFQAMRADFHLQLRYAQDDAVMMDLEQKLRQF